MAFFVEQALSITPDNSLLAFTQTIERECLQGSAIHPQFWRTAIDLVADTETRSGGDVVYPIHEALNWQIVRFGRQARETQSAALFLNEDGSCWQAKLQHPLWDKTKQKPRKYETPVGAGSRAYFPPIPITIRKRIEQSYGLTIPTRESFWNWVRTSSVPIVVTEGAKKALALLSQGYVAIALYGVNGGYRSKDALGNPCVPYLIEDLQPFIQSGRSVFLAFDQDATATTRHQVNREHLTYAISIST